MTVLNPDLEKNKNVIRYFLQQIANDDLQAVCIIETPEFKWCCGTKTMLSRLCSREGVKATPSDSHEELQVKNRETEKLEDDADVFEREQMALDTKWKFIGDCAFLLTNEEHTDSSQKFDNVEVNNVDQRKRRRSSSVEDPTDKDDDEEEEIAPKLSRTETLTKDLKDAIFGSIKFEVHDLDESEASIKETTDEVELISDNDSMKPFVCNICTSAFLTKEELKAHACTHTQPKPYQCDICSKGFSTKSNMQRHRNIHTKEKVFQCPHHVCAKKFYDSGNLKRHVEGVHSSKEAKDFDIKDKSMDDRSNSPIEEPALAITFDDVESTQSSFDSVKNALLSANTPSIKTEIKMENEPREPPEIPNMDSDGQTYTCDRCLLRFTSKQDSADHLKAVHQGTENQHCLRVEQPGTISSDKPFTYKLFYCDFCWKEFTWRANLVRHINIHTHEKSFPCSMCKKSFSSHTSLRRHEQKHQGVHYKCSKCSRPFNDPSNLRRHEIACSGEKGDDMDHPEDESEEVENDKTKKIEETEEQMKPHRCGYCHKSFGRAERLEEHLRTHTGETPFKCDICGKGFTTKHNLLRHRNIHTLDKKYTCEYCGKFFADPTQHKRHQATHFAKQNKGKITSRSDPIDSSPVSLVIPKFGQPSNYSNIFVNEKIETS